ncbi:class-III pyridoxal-phosphate-dependent aminotransferase [Sandaracinobacteroides saxicola]|uniref:Aspartate aminotransferase family protein n=1 Tax=Sandaracinobacteroides saxicola TaxID=2759707 RepID=A0A7G5ILE8_9SPHN|nr:aminotransferase class III-fold pyridoxal phosphate-dependent enzyme [Sandaracinobacteroides saxicola]QMW24190.1 aspartate aminotransferase family protein [Sandaracinobacteroides saxicola]
MLSDHADTIALTARHLHPHRLGLFRSFGVEIVMGKREGYRFADQSGRWLHDLHLNGGTFNLGHRNPVLCGVLAVALTEVDIGNHHFPSPARARLAQQLLATQGFGADHVVFSTTGSEAVDVAIKAARRATGRRAIVSIDRGYHGRTGLSGAAGDDDAARYFLSDSPAEFVRVPWNDAEAMEVAVRTADAAAVILEPLPATYGFPLPAPGYLAAVRDICTRHDALFIADEVQTGLCRSGDWWAIEHFGVQPDILVTSKGLGGGLYPIAATLLTPRPAAWLAENGWAHVSTFGGAELGCHVASAVIDISGQPETRATIAASARHLGDGLRAIQRDTDYLVEVRQTGLIFGLKFDHEQGALHMMKALLDEGVWAMFSGFDTSVLQFKPGLLLTPDACDDILKRVRRAVTVAAAFRHAAPLGIPG